MSYREVSELANIQHSFNQALGTAGVLVGISGIPQARASKKAEADKEAKEQQRLDKQAEVTSKAVDEASKNIDIDNPMIPENDAYINALKNAESARKAQFERNPSESTYGEYQSAFTRRVNASSDLENARSQWKKEWDDLVSRQEQAMADMESKKEAMKTQKDNIRKHIEGLPISLGGKVKDLDNEFRDQVIKKYMEAENGKKQRKTV